MQHHGASVAHDVRVGLVQNLDIVTGRVERVDQIAVEAILQPQPGLRRAPGPPEHPARAIDRFGERFVKQHVACEKRSLRLRLAVAAHGAVRHNTSVFKHRERRIERVERQPAGRERIERAAL